MTVDNIQSDPVNIFLYYQVGAEAPLTLVYNEAKEGMNFDPFEISVSKPGLNAITGGYYDI